MERSTPILCPYAGNGPHPGLKRILKECGYPITWVDCTGKEGAYEDAFRRLWLKKQDFAIFEHDMVPTQEQIDELINCKEDWCSVAYTHPWARAKNGYTIFHAFGGVRFRAKLMIDHPDIISKMLDPNENGNKYWRWIQMDSRFNTVANRAGLIEHQHSWNVVKHWHWTNENIVMDGCSQARWEAEHEMPWDVVRKLNPHLPSEQIEDCYGTTVSVHHCRPLPGQLLICDERGQIVYDSRKL